MRTAQVRRLRLPERYYGSRSSYRLALTIWCEPMTVKDEVVMSENWQRARLIPVAGTSTGVEREQRATSALLAVLSVVRPFSRELLSPLKASRAGRACVESFIETSLTTSSKAGVRPDGLIRVTYGKQAPWIALVEVKTGTNPLTLEQINSYIDCARHNKYDHVITISNEIA